METLVGAGLMPVDRTVRKSLERLDPYALRKEALDRRLSPSEIGRALFHLNQRRGFKSNRIISDSDHDERSSMKQGIKRLEVELESAGVRTLGELLANGRLGPGGGSVRFRPERKGSKNLYAFYPTRSMIESEVDAIWKSQRRWHSDLLTDELLRKIKHIIVDQRPLKPQVPGRCTLFSEDERAPKAHPLFQRFRIFQDVGSLRVREGLSERPLRLDERDHVVLALASCVGAGSGGIVPFERLRAHAGLLDGARLNSEGAADRRKGFACDETSLKLRSKKAFDRVWDGLPHERRCAVVERLLEVQGRSGPVFLASAGVRPFSGYGGVRLRGPFAAGVRPSGPSGPAWARGGLREGVRGVGGSSSSPSTNTRRVCHRAHQPHAGQSSTGRPGARPRRSARTSTDSQPAATRQHPITPHGEQRQRSDLAVPSCPHYPSWGSVTRTVRRSGRGPTRVLITPHASAFHTAGA